MNIFVAKIAEHFGREVVKAVVYTAAVTGAAHLASRIVDEFMGGNDIGTPPVIVNVVVTQDGVEVSRQTLGEADDGEDEADDLCDLCDGDCDGCQHPS